MKTKKTYFKAIRLVYPDQNHFQKRDLCALFSSGQLKAVEYDDRLIY